MTRMPFLSRGKLYVVETDDPRTKRLIARYWGDAVNHFLRSGDTSRLDRYRNQTYRGHPYDVDPESIVDFFLSTDFDFQELYEP